jgi:hypothetical protein
MFGSKRLFKVTFVAAATLTTALAFFACGDNKSTSPTPKVATADAEVQVTQNTAPVLYDAPLSFDAGVPALGTSVATTLAFTENPADSTAPLFSLTTATDTANGTMAFGSCHFIVGFATAGLAPEVVTGDTVIIDPCKVTLKTSGKSVEVQTETESTLQLGTITSSAVIKNVVVTPSGNVTIVTDKGVIHGGTVPVANPTGT